MTISDLAPTNARALADGFAAILADGTIGSRQRAIALGGLFWRHQSTILAALRTTDPTSPSGGDGGAEAMRAMDSYPRQAVAYSYNPTETTDWGPEVLLRIPPCEAYPHGPVYVTGHLEADEWLSRDAADPAAWGGLAAEPTGWLPLPADADGAAALPLPQDQAPRQGGEV